MAGVRQGDKTMTSRLKELERTTSDPIETDIQKAIQLSLEEFEREKELRTMAGILPDPSDIDQHELQDKFSGLHLWKKESLPAKLDKVRMLIDPSLVQLSEDMPYPEQLELMKQISRETAPKSRTEECSPNFDETNLAQALERSLDPKEQVKVNEPSLANESMDEMLLKGLKESKRHHLQQSLLLDLDAEKAIGLLEQQAPGCPRPIIIDGNNVAFSHGNHEVFSAKGIAFCYQYFIDRGHDNIIAFCSPKIRHQIVDEEYLQRLKDIGVLKQMNSLHYDDLLIIRAAKENGGIIVSNDQFRDITNQDRFQDLHSTIKTRVLHFEFVGDKFIPVEDPRGRHGPLLNDFLRF